MSKILHQAKHYVKYLLRAKSAHGIHSPFVFDLVTNILQNETRYYCFREIEGKRAELKASDQIITRTDLGAGTANGNQMKIGSFARKSLCPPKYCRLFFHLIQRLRYKKVLELGTALGITTSYLASGDCDEVITMEGDPELINIASTVWGSLGLSRIQVYEGDFSNAFERLETESSPQKIDMAFVDGNHRKEPTLEYVKFLKKHLNKNGLIIIDDIYWSKEMTEAWEILKEDDFFSISIDLYRMGLLFNREQVEKQEFILKY